MPRALLAAAIALGTFAFATTAHATEGTEGQAPAIQPLGDAVIAEGPAAPPAPALDYDTGDDTGARRMEVGKWTMVGGAAGVGVGGVLVASGFGLIGRCMEDFFTSDNEHLCDHGARTLGAGSLFIAAGAITVLAGGITYGVGKGKQRRARRARTQVTPGLAISRQGVSSGVTVRF